MSINPAAALITILDDDSKYLFPCAFSLLSSDYTAKSNFRINFPPTGRARIRVSIINDDIVEITERFIGNLKTTDLKIRIQQSMAQVDITDSDGIV